MAASDAAAGGSSCKKRENFVINISEETVQGWFVPKTTLTPFSENDLPKKTLWTNNSPKSKSTIQCCYMQNF